MAKLIFQDHCNQKSAYLQDFSGPDANFSTFQGPIFYFIIQDFSGA